MDEGVKRIIDQAVALDARRQAEAEALRVHGGQLAGFWVRVGADALDAVVLFAFGWALSLPLRSLFERLGERGVFIGLAVSMAYSGILHSRYGGGRTVGKRLLGLRVVRLDGSLLSLDRALVRYALMGLLVYQSAVVYALAAVVPFLNVAWAQAVVSGMAFALFVGCVLVVPFHPLKRGLHDILAGTIVVRRGMPDPVFVAGQSNRRRDRAIVAGAAALAAAAVGVSILVLRPLAASMLMKQASVVLEPLRGLDMTNVGVQLDAVSTDGGPRVVTLSGTGYLPRPAGGGEPDWAMSEASFIQAVRGRLGPDSGIDRIGTVFRSGFNIGIYKSYETRIYAEDARTGEVVDQRAIWTW